MKINELMDMMNYNLSRENSKSMLGDIQKEITNLFFKNPNLTQDMMDSFEANLYSNPAIFSANVDYSGVKDVGAYFSMKKQEFLNSKQLGENKTL